MDINCLNRPIIWELVNDISDLLIQVDLRIHYLIQSDGIEDA